MSVLPREQIQIALYNRLVAALGASINFSSRRYIEYADLVAQQQPALIVVAIGDMLESQDPANLQRHHLRAMVILYTRDDNAAQDATTTPETALFALVALVEAGLKPQPGDAGNPFAAVLAPSTTLGGLVKHTWIKDVHIHHGVGAGQAGVTMTIDLLAVEQP